MSTIMLDLILASVTIVVYLAFAYAVWVSFKFVMILMKDDDNE